MKKKSCSLDYPVFAKSLLSVLIAFNVSAVCAQETQSSTEANKAEEVFVYGVRQALENALEVKRNSTSIVDAISSEDIGNFPALDLGEALQSIPGVQVNRESERRQSEVSLRGFAGGYILQTANGQEFANPTRSFNIVSASPFGAFEASVFKGITVYKSQQADLIEGGIAGVIEKKLPDALAKKESGGGLAVGARYEHLNDSWDPEFTLEGHHHFIEDKLAAYFIVAGSDQNFRRDTIFPEEYRTLTTVTGPTAGTAANSGSRFFTGGAPAFTAWKALYGITNIDEIVVQDRGRQLTEYNSGDRKSMTGNIVFKPTDELKLNLDLLYTDRNMDDSTFEAVQINFLNANSTIFPLSDPILLGEKTVNGVPRNLYAVTDISFSNAQISWANRPFKFHEVTRGGFLTAEWERDELKLASTITKTHADNDFIQVNISSQINPSAPLAGVPRNNGVNGRYSNGRGDIDDYLFVLNNPTVSDFLDLPFQATPALPAEPTQVVVTPALADGAQRSFGIAGGTQIVDRDMETADFSAEYTLDLGLLESVKGGVRWAKDSLGNGNEDNSLIGTDSSRINSSFYQLPNGATGTSFFNGNAPGVLTAAGGWVSMNPDRIISALTEGMVVPPGYRILPESGLIAKNIRSETTIRRSFEADIETSAVFLMANLRQQLAEDVEMSGNIGFRYFESEVEATAKQAIRAVETSGIKSSNNYDHLLPSINLNFSMPNDIILRLAANKGIVRPNLRRFFPSQQVTLTNNTIIVALPDTEVDPLEAKSYDATIEWYNRPGSNLAISLFHKEFKGDFLTQQLCPETLQIDGQTYQMQFNSGQCLPDRPIFLPGDTVGFSAVTISRNVNNPAVSRRQGYEISAQQNLDFLPGFWSGFGGQATYTYFENLEENSILLNTSKNAYNIVTYWENEDVSVRLTYNWRSTYKLQSNGASAFGGVGIRNVKPRGQLDMLIKYNIMDDLNVSLRAFNMTDVLYQEYDEQSEFLPRRINYDGRTYSVSLNYKF